MTDLVFKDKTVIIPSHYLPVRELLAAIVLAKRIYVDTDEIWRKQTLANRTFILGANGPQTLSVPVRHTGGIKTPMREMRISYAQPWIRVHKGAIFSAYNTSPFFPFFKDELFEIYDKRHELLYALNLEILKFLLKKLKYKGEVLESFPQGEISDLRSMVHPDALKSSLKTGAPYQQVFGYKFPFCSHLSALDCLANTGMV